MYVYEKQVEELLNKILEQTSNDLRVKSKILTDLLFDEDWAFIIKGHSLLEMIISEMISYKVDESLFSLFERMPLHGDVSKVTITKSLKLLTNEEMKFLIKISEIRNMVVHKFENINFSFENYYEALDKNQKKSWKRLFIALNLDEETKELINDYLGQKFKVFVWSGISGIVISCLNQIHEDKGLKLLKVEEEKTTKELLKDALSLRNGSENDKL